MSRQMRQTLAALRAHLDGLKPRPPEGSRVVWSAFIQLSERRTWHANGPNPISFPEIAAYCHLLRRPLEPRHIEILLAMDRLWINAALVRTTQAKGVLPKVSGQPITPELLDAMLG